MKRHGTDGTDGQADRSTDGQNEPFTELLGRS